MRRYTIMLAMLVITSVTQGYEYSDYTWHTYNGHQYAATIDYCNWADAEAEAVTLGGHLVTVNDAAENAWLSATFGGYDDAGHHGVWAHLIWIGLEHISGDITDPSTWQWVSGEPLTYTGNWYSGSPVGPPGGGPHAYLHPSTHPIPGTWFNAAARDTNPDSYPHGIIEISGPMLVEIDIKPGSYPNAINLGSHGLIPIAVLSSEDFDATTVDPDTVELAGADVAMRGKSNKSMAHEEDVNGDGLIDLVVQVETANLDPESFQDGWAILTGSTYDGQAIEGWDEITIVPPEE